jgi:hypothetical protein
MTLAFGLVPPAQAQEFNGENCRLSAPPANSGEIFLEVGKVTVAGRVYPRLSQIPGNYTGCQVLWASINGGRVARSVTLFEAGRVVSVNPLPDGIPLCEADEKVAETGCTSRKTAVPVSYPAGCAARVVESKAIPRDCIDALQAEFRLHDRIAD